MFTNASFPNKKTTTTSLNVSLDNDSFGSNLSLTRSESGGGLPSRLRLHRDLVQEILLLAIFMEGSMRQYTPLCLVCRDWNELLNEPYAWANLARRFVPAFPLIHTMRFVPIVVPEALASLGSDASSLSLLSSPTLGMPPSSIPASDTTPSRTDNGPEEQDLSRLTGGRRFSPPPALSGTNGSFDLRPMAPVVTGAGGSSNKTNDGCGPFQPRMIRKRILRLWARRRRQVLRTMREAMRAEEDEELKRHGVEPSRETVKAAVEGLREYRRWLIMNKIVARRRRFVLQAWMSAGLFFTSCAVAADVCAAETWAPQSFCHFDTGFSFLYLAYLCVFGVAISNVFMVTHYEPLALIPRMGRNTPLIAVSAVFLTAWILGVIVPTYLIQLKVGSIVNGSISNSISIPMRGGGGAELEVKEASPAAVVWSVHDRDVGGLTPTFNVNSDERLADGTSIIECVGAPAPERPQPTVGITWVETVFTLTVAMGMWQVGVVVTLWRELVGWARRPTLRWAHIGYLVPHLTPTLLAGSAVAFAKYLDTGSFWLLAITALPLLGIFGVLTVIFSADAYHHARESDIMVAIALGNVVVTLLLVLAADTPRGLHVAPLFACSVALFVGQMRSMMRLLDSVLWDEEDEE